MSYLFETKRVIERKAFKRASSLVEEKIKEIRSNTPNLPFEKTKLVVTSVLHDKELILKTGADLYIPKPYEISNLVKWVEKLLND